MAALLFMVLRVLVGLLVIKTGVDLAQGNHALSRHQDFEPFITGLFIVLIGIQIVISSIFKK